MELIPKYNRHFMPLALEVKPSNLLPQDPYTPKKVPNRTGPCCTPSTIFCHSYGLASHQVLHDLALSCTISHKK